MTAPPMLTPLGAPGSCAWKRGICAYATDVAQVSAASPRDNRMTHLSRTARPGSIARITRARTPGFMQRHCAVLGCAPESPMPRVVGIDHLVLSVSDLDRSKAYYGRVLGFLG